MAEARYVALAEVARPHGVQGELRLKVYNLDSDVLLGRPRVRLVAEDGTATPTVIRSARRVPNAILVRLDGVATRDAAEALRGAKLEVRRDELDPVAEDEGEHYIADLVGCRVHLGGDHLGEVVAVESYPSCDALVVVGEGRRLEVPLTANFVIAVDADQRTIEVANIEGLEG